MQVKLVCTDLVALARSRPDRHSGKSHCQAFANVSSGSFLSVGGGSKAPVRRRPPHRPEAYRMSAWANSGLMHSRRVPLFDHLVDIGELLGQPRFAKTLNHQLRIF